MSRAEKNPIVELLRRNGVDDPAAYLREAEQTHPIGRASAPDVFVRGSVPLMKDRTITREEIDEGFKKLKYF